MEVPNAAAKVVKKSRSHLLRHELPNVDLEVAFGTKDLREIAKDIARWGQKELQVRAEPEISAADDADGRPAHAPCARRRRSSRSCTARRPSATTTTGCEES